MFAVGPSSFMQPYSFYQYTWASGFPDTSTFSTSITTFICTSLQSTVAFLGKVYKSTIPTADFRSTYTNFTSLYPGRILTSSMFLGTGLQDLIETKQYNVFVDFQYNLYLSTPYDSYSWVSTTGYLGSNVGTTGRTVTTRVGNQSFETIRESLTYAPQLIAEQTQIGFNASNFFLDIRLNSSINATSTYSPAFDIYVPGENNFTFTLVPVTSTVTLGA